ncbi:hypothetical protein GNX18_17635 [Microbulbifer sp. SH-1]|uniref:hypothetical protein n=1 Tax=Microbulbifer sp. SH-1 TaxID=2681547 RepID=UPI00140DFADB|nr:hypothetical protein [Microbulbifer sp. SH-1]QIL91400.1 hypothetical protein GNX18_17635 [Microbulbifer sp. SH-1]
MKTMFLLLFLYSGLSYGSTPEAVASKYLENFSSHRYSAAAKMIYCGEGLSEAELSDKYAGLSKELKFLDDEFGAVTQYNVSNDHMYVAATLGCGSHDFLETNLGSAKVVVFGVTYNNKSPGYIVVKLISVNDKFLPITVDHGIPMDGLFSTARIMSVYKKLTEL